MSFLRKPSEADRQNWSRAADWLAAAVAAALPWSTTATAILTVLWAIALVPTVRMDELRETLAQPAAYLPIALVAFAALGLAWGVAPSGERLRGLEPFAKFLAIPLLLIQFRRSERGIWVLAAFLVSGIALLAASGLTILHPRPGKGPGIPVKDYIAQSAVFTLCAFGLLWLAHDWLRARRIVGIAAVALALLFFANIAYVVSSRTALVTIPVLALILSLRFSHWKVSVLSVAGLALVSAAIWTSSPNVRDRLSSVSEEIVAYRDGGERTSAGERLEFWRRSLMAMQQAPVLGHGTGAIRDVFRRSATGEGMGALVTANPHNQYLAVGVQLGTAGVALLLAMWIAQLLLFRGQGLLAYAGTLVVAQNMLGSLANSHLFDSTHGWLYVFAIGTLGGMALRQRGAPAPQPAVQLRPDATSAS